MYMRGHGRICHAAATSQRLSPRKKSQATQIKLASIFFAQRDAPKAKKLQALLSRYTFVTHFLELSAAGCHFKASS